MIRKLLEKISSLLRGLVLVVVIVSSSLLWLFVIEDAEQILENRRSTNGAVYLYDSSGKRIQQLSLYDFTFSGIVRSAPRDAPPNGAALTT